MGGESPGGKIRSQIDRNYWPAASDYSQDVEAIAWGKDQKEIDMSGVSIAVSVLTKNHDDVVNILKKVPIEVMIEILPNIRNILATVDEQNAPPAAQQPKIFQDGKVHGS